MKKLLHNEQILALKNKTIIIQKYHEKSKDNSRFDINIKDGEYLRLIHSVGGMPLKGNKKTLIKKIYLRNKKQLLYIADPWLQKLFKGD